MKTRLPLSILTLAVGILLGWAICAAFPRAGGALETDIKSLRSDPDRYSNKLVQVSGKLTECYAWECSLCPETMTTSTRNSDQCLALEFRALMPETGFGGAEQEALFRFASVTLQARFDPSCWTLPCTDRASVLQDAQVQTVSTRRKSVEGLWINETTAIATAPQQVSARVIAAAYLSGFPKNVPIKVFQSQGDSRLAIACWALVGLGAPVWPTTLEGAVYAKTINDLYSCSRLRLQNETWNLQTDPKT